MHLRLRWCCGCACLWAGATLPNESGGVHLGSPADIFFALLRASRLAFGAAFLSRGKRFRRWRRPFDSGLPNNLRRRLFVPHPNKSEVPKLSSSVHSTNAT